MNTPAIIDTSDRSDDVAMFELSNVIASIKANLKMLSFNAPRTAL